MHQKSTVYLTCLGKLSLKIPSSMSFLIYNALLITNASSFELADNTIAVPHLSCGHVTLLINVQWLVHCHNVLLVDLNFSVWKSDE